MRKAAAMCRVALVIAISLLAAAAPARADVIRWQLNQFVFGDGGTATGFFDWDTVAHTSTNWEISVAGGNTATFPPLTYNDETTSFSQGVAPNNTLYFFTPGIRVFRIALTSIPSLDIPVAVLGLGSNAQTGGTGFVECFNCSPVRFESDNVDGYLSAVPEPATWLLLSGGVFAAVQRRRTRA